MSPNGDSSTCYRVESVSHTSRLRVSSSCTYYIPLPPEHRKNSNSTDTCHTNMPEKKKHLEPCNIRGTPALEMGMGLVANTRKNSEIQIKLFFTDDFFLKNHFQTWSQGSRTAKTLDPWDIPGTRSNPSTLF